jgi:alkanesulfonate monooxygenase SsuD/methylene tetrahydromethanopterin reductase-like flavin-dependent oxidoreductase (luciferase family)
MQAPGLAQSTRPTPIPANGREGDPVTKVRFGIRLPVIAPSSGVDHIIETAIEAEQLGYDSLFVGDHVAPGGKLAFERHKLAPPGAGSIEDPTSTLDPNQFEMIATLSYVAAKTSVIEVGSGVTPLLLRDPILLAKQIGTLDALAGGRFIFGVGVANVTDKEEFVSLKVPYLPYAERYEQISEYVAAMKTIWEQPRSTFHGKYIDFDELIIYPKPARKVPIWLGAGTLAGSPDYPPVKFALQHADGLMWPFLTTPDDVRAMITEYTATASAAGRDISGFEWCCQRRLAIGESRAELSEQVDWVAREQGDMGKFSGYMHDLGEKAAATNIAAAHAGLPDQITRVIQNYVDAGANHFDVFFTHRNHAGFLRQARLFAREVIPAITAPKQASVA